MILGRRAGDYAPRSFGGFDCEVVDDSRECVFEKGRMDVVLPLDMPLVLPEDILRATECVRRRKLGALGLGDKESGARVVFDEEGDGGYFLSSPRFCKVGGAKNDSLVYNQMKERIINRLLSVGVYVVDTANTVVDDTVRIGAGAVILPFCRLTGQTVIESGATVEGSLIKDSTVGEGATVSLSHVVDSDIGCDSTVGPFARLRGARIAAGCRIGDFVEIKGSVLHEGVKSAHLTYVGDAEVGAKTNLGCGTVFCNYDGKNKHRTQVGEGCFIGANSNLVAPLKIGDGVFVAAGTTVTKDVDDGNFVIGRSRQEVRPALVRGNKKYDTDNNKGGEN